jgi:hypothetical protein
VYPSQHVLRKHETSLLDAHEFGRHILDYLGTIQHPFEMKIAFAVITPCASLNLEIVE